MKCNVTREYIRTHEFIKTGLEEQEDGGALVSARFAPGIKLPKSDAEKRAELRVELSNIVYAKTETYVQAHIMTGINEETLRKYIRKGSNSNFKRLFVAQIVIGLGVDFEKANELFTLQGCPLDPENILLDAIVVNCMECHENRDTFWEMCRENGIEW